VTLGFGVGVLWKAAPGLGLLLVGDATSVRTVASSPSSSSSSSSSSSLSPGHSDSCISVNNDSLDGVMVDDSATPKLVADFGSLAVEALSGRHGSGFLTEYVGDILNGHSTSGIFLW